MQHEVPAGLQGLSSIDAQTRLAEAGPNRWVKRDRLARLREVLSLLLDPMAVMLVVAATVYYFLGETRDAVVLAVALLPVLGVDVVLRRVPAPRWKSWPGRRRPLPTWSGTGS